MADTFFAHPTALVETNQIGEKTNVWAYAHVMKGAVVGRHCNIGDHAFVESGAVVGDEVTIKNSGGVAACHDREPRLPRAQLLAHERQPLAQQRERTPVATTIREGATIGANATIVCGARRLLRVLSARARSSRSRARTTPSSSQTLPRRRGHACECCQPPAYRGRSWCARSAAALHEDGKRRRPLRRRSRRPTPKPIGGLTRRSETRRRPGDASRPGSSRDGRLIAHDEASKIGRVIERFPPGLVDRIVVVNDASTDETPAVAAEKGAVVLTHARRSGAGAAVRTAIKYAMAEGFDVLVVLAGNDKDRPPEIERLLAPVADGGYDFVQGSRYLPGGDFGNMPFYRQLATRYVHPLLFSLYVGRRFTDTTNGFRAIRLSALRDARIDIDQPWLDHYEPEPYLFFKMIRLGYKVTEVPVTKIHRRTNSATPR
jgi:dolichol-phosphate mannosyltransferase